jgi:transporter family-2 protein
MERAARMDRLRHRLSSASGDIHDVLPGYTSQGSALAKAGVLAPGAGDGCESRGQAPADEFEKALIMLYLLAFAAGLVLTIQVGANSTLRTALGNPAMATLTSFVVGLLGVVLFLVFTRADLPTRAALSAAPAWAWVGGLLGAFYVATTVIVGPRLGAAALLALTVLGQLLASLVVDHYGWLGFPQHSMSVVRLLGAALLFVGVLLIVR